ncbi:unnamed protein product, partial [Brenthis ino]
MKIPGPEGLPIVGNSYKFIQNPVEIFKYIRHLFRKYGCIIQFHAINGRAIGILDPELIEVILSSNRYNEKSIPYNFLRPWLREGLLISNGQKWHQRRKLLTQAFHFNILKKYFATFTEKTEDFLVKVQEKVGEHKTDLTPLINATTLRVMCETAMGTSMKDDIESVANKYSKAIEVVGTSVIERLCRIWLHSDFLFKLSNRAKVQEKALKDLHVFTSRIIRERRIFLNENNINAFDDAEDYGKKGRLAMLDLLLENEKIGNIDTVGIREEVDTFMFEGQDTTAQALIYLLMSIANETKVQEKIYEEMQKIFGDSRRCPTMEDLNEMKYLECCIKESLRLYPSVPIIVRYVTEEVPLGDFVVPSNCHIFISIYDLHRREDLYAEPERFIPERFLPENVQKRHPYAYIPFSAGPRNCIGQKFAMLEIKIIVSSILRRFRLEGVTKPFDLIFKTDMLLRTAEKPIYVRFYNRD